MIAGMAVSTALAGEFHVSKSGDDENAGSAAEPFKTIGAAAQVAQPGDVITVHEGTYRERVNPPRGGISDEERITYRAAPGEEVMIKGSEVVDGWEHVRNDTWKVTLPNEFFGDFNPYNDLIAGDWFDRRGRDHHTGAVYLNGHWLTEAAELADVLEPVRENPIWAYPPPSDFLLNLAWLSVGERDPFAASEFAAKRGIGREALSELGDGVAYINHGDWVRYDQLDFGSETRRMTFGAASQGAGGLIEVRLDAADGELLGSVFVPYTGSWHVFEPYSLEIPPTSGLQTVYLVFKSADQEPRRNPLWKPGANPADPALWHAEVDESETTIWAQFKEVDPNEEKVEINVRQTVFYPDEPGRDYITVRGFKMMHAATPWAPPTAEQIGLIGTHWSRGWIIEDNDISYSTCTGITLGKHGDEYDNTSADTAEGYVETIRRARDNHGWSKENIGHHIVRNNRISHCEQAGLVGSLGPIFSEITDNVIHDIHVRQMFSGAEMAGIKLHAPIDTLIARNHIYRTARGMWLDWMTQGTRVTRNLLHDNDVFEDLFIEVNHGPYVVDNNILLSRTALYDNSQGGAYVHNLFAGGIVRSAEFNRDTPYHKAHSTEIVGLHNIQNGDNRFYNNLFAGGPGLASYDEAILPVYYGGNAFLNGALPAAEEEAPVVLPDFDPRIEITREDEKVILSLDLDPAFAHRENRLVTTDLLGEAEIPGLPYKDHDGSPLRIDTDYTGAVRDESNPFTGPFEEARANLRESDGPARVSVTLWPQKD